MNIDAVLDIAAGVFLGIMAINIFGYILHSLFGGQDDMEEEYDDEEEGAPPSLKDAIDQDGSAEIKVTIEEIKGSWYGFYHSPVGEVFVAQGATYEEALENCEQRLKDENFQKTILVEQEAQ